MVVICTLAAMAYWIILMVNWRWGHIASIGIALTKMARLPLFLVAIIPLFFYNFLLALVATIVAVLIDFAKMREGWRQLKLARKKNER